MYQALIFFLSFVICAFGQPAWIGPFCVLAASIGYALFWHGYYKGFYSFFHAFLWFFAVELIHLSWMTSIRYQGFLMILVYLLLAVALAVQFSLFSFFLKRQNLANLTSILALASIWVLMEWSRLFFISGYTWNPIGLSLSWSVYSVQLASIFGVYGLTFYVILTNLFFLRAFISWEKRDLIVAMLIAIFPYFLGNTIVQRSALKSTDKLQALLIHTSLTPEEKEPFFDPEAFLPPIEQWSMIFDSLKEYQNEKMDLIVLPEGALPYEAFSPTIPFKIWHQKWTSLFGEKGDKAFLEAIKHPPLRPRYGQVSNALVVQSIANLFDADVVIGLRDEEDDLIFNSAFHFTPSTFSPDKYAKRVLVPVAEYIPFEWCRSFAADYGILSFFTPGKEPRVFEGKKSLMSVSICYEETYSNIMQEGKKLGAQLFVNITNDIWFPGSRLAKQHYDHGILRAVENGIPVVRATNHGITGGVDSFGREIKILPFYDRNGALLLSVPLGTVNTLFSYWGNRGIVFFSVFFICFYLACVTDRFRSEVST